MRFLKVRIASFVITAAALLSGCGNRYLSPRSTNPLLEDRVRMGDSREQKMSVLTSRADRRTILVFGKKRVCAEPPPDVAEAVFSQAVAELEKDDVKAAVGTTLQTALMQLTRRSQGLDYYRTGAFVNCMMHYNGVLGPAEYIKAMETLLDKSVAMTMEEMQHLPAMATAIAQVTKLQPPTRSAGQSDEESGESRSDTEAGAEAGETEDEED